MKRHIGVVSDFSHAGVVRRGKSKWFWGATFSKCFLKWSQKPVRTFSSLRAIFSSAAVWLLFSLFLFSLSALILLKDSTCVNNFDSICLHEIKLIFNNCTAIAEAIIGLLLVFLQFEEFELNCGAVLKKNTFFNDFDLSKRDKQVKPRRQ